MVQKSEESQLRSNLALESEGMVLRLEICWAIEWDLALLSEKRVLAEEKLRGPRIYLLGSEGGIGQLRLGKR